MPLVRISREAGKPDRTAISNQVYEAMRETVSPSGWRYHRAYGRTT